jgi:hypothetical protein
VPFSASAIIDRKELLERLEALAEAIPGELKKARWIIEDRDEVLARIQREAQETLERARQERERMLSRPEIENAASLEADRVIEMAKAQARDIRLDAEHFVDGKLASLEVALQKMVALVQSASASFVDRSGAGFRPGPQGRPAGRGGPAAPAPDFAPTRAPDRTDLPREPVKGGSRAPKSAPGAGTGPRERGPRPVAAPGGGNATRSLGLGTPGTRPKPSRPQGPGAGTAADGPAGPARTVSPAPPPRPDGETTAEITRRSRPETGGQTGPQDRVVVDLRNEPEAAPPGGKHEDPPEATSPEGQTPLF